MADLRDLWTQVVNGGRMRKMIVNAEGLSAIGRAVLAFDCLLAQVVRLAW